MSDDEREHLLGREARFHDAWADEVDPGAVDPFRAFEVATCPENRFIDAWLGDVRGLRVVELGCGLGEASSWFARRGAEVLATDISAGMCRVATAVAAARGLTIETRVSSADALDLPDASVDVVYAANLLHHVDIDACVAEVHRVLRPGGRACFWDPLAHNPVINVYRWMATQVRTPDEHPLTMQDVARIRGRFGGGEVRFFWLTSLLIFLRFFLWDRVHPNAVRYWKKILDEAEQLEGTYRPLARLDDVLLRYLPFLGRWCWNVVLCLEK